MEFNFSNNNKDYRVEIGEQNGKGTRICVNGKEFFYSPQEDGQAAAVPQAAIPKRDLSKKEIAAPLAGTISEVAVKAGDIVKAGQKLLTLSAMKMENEIPSETDGKIKEIKAAPNQKVMEGDILIILA